jgi:hypothetical protein
MAWPAHFFARTPSDRGLLADNGFTPDIDDDALARPTTAAPAVNKSLIKERVAFAWALAQEGSEPVSETRRFAHVEPHRRPRPPGLGLFRPWTCGGFPPTAVSLAMVQALTARVESLVVHVGGPSRTRCCFGCDLLSAGQIFTREPGPILSLLAGAGEGVCVDLAASASTTTASSVPIRPPTACPEPAPVRVPQAYRDVTAETAPQARPYIAYAARRRGARGHGRTLPGCWPWDVITPDTFRASLPRSSNPIRALMKIHETSRTSASSPTSTPARRP